MEREEYKIGENQIFVERLTPDRASDTSEELEIYDRPVVLIHGAFGGSFSWNKISSALCEEGFECISPSLRGHGPSGGSLGSVGLGDYVEDIEVVVDELGLEKPVIIGHSMGGLIGFLYARKHIDDVEAIVGLDPALPKEIWDIEETDILENLDDPVGLEDIEGGMDISKVRDRVPDISPEYAVDMVRRANKEPKKVWEQIVDGVSIPSDSFKDTPLLLMGVEFDNALKISVPAEKIRDMAEKFNGDFFAVKGATHSGIVMGEHAGEVGSIIADWLREQEELSESIQ
ncbi:MAG: alpha/beta fold hydrolase [Candidatus Magasanikbacteria bacterium]